jgi:hypothetical protein
MQLYLIAHKVRGEPALDIAQQLHVGNEVWWIIPTSGHRAYPYFHTPAPDVDVIAPPMPEDLPDHYQTQARIERPTKSALESNTERRKTTKAVVTIEDLLI